MQDWRLMLCSMAMYRNQRIAMARSLIVKSDRRSVGGCIRFLWRGIRGRWMFDSYSVCSFVQVVLLLKMAHMHAALLFPFLSAPANRVEEGLCILHVFCCRCFFCVAPFLLHRERDFVSIAYSILNITTFQRRTKNLPSVILRT